MRSRKSPDGRLIRSRYAAYGRVSRSMPGTSWCLRLVLLASLLSLSFFSTLTTLAQEIGTIPFEAALPPEYASLIGPTQFKFVIVSADDEVLWQNDGGTSGEPAAAVVIYVQNGRYKIELGSPDLGMAPIPPSVLQSMDIYLNVWIRASADRDFALIVDKFRLLGHGYAQVADLARNAERLQGHKASDFEPAGAVARHEEKFHTGETSGGGTAPSYSGTLSLAPHGSGSIYIIVPDGASRLDLRLYGIYGSSQPTLDSLEFKQARIANQKVGTTEDVLNIRGQGWLAGIRESYEFCNSCFKRRLAPNTFIYIDGTLYQEWTGSRQEVNTRVDVGRIENFIPFGLLKFEKSLRVTSYQPGYDNALGTTTVWYYVAEKKKTAPAGVQIFTDGTDITEKAVALLSPAGAEAHTFVDGKVLMSLRAGQSFSKPDAFSWNENLPGSPSESRLVDGLGEPFEPEALEEGQGWIATWEGLLKFPGPGDSVLKMQSSGVGVLELYIKDGWVRFINCLEPDKDFQNRLYVPEEMWIPFRIATSQETTEGHLTVRMASQSGEFGLISADQLRSPELFGGASGREWKTGSIPFSASDYFSPGEHRIEFRESGGKGGNLYYILSIE
jgi:hypothetical protein